MGLETHQLVHDDNRDTVHFRDLNDVFPRTECIFILRTRNALTFASDLFMQNCIIATLSSIFYGPHWLITIVNKIFI